MTDRLNGLTVVFEENMRDDDADAIISAIGQLRGVLKVVPEVADHDSYVSDTRARYSLLEALQKTAIEWRSK